MALKRLQVGREGESAEIAFLKENGYRILEKNFRSKLGEIDLIAEQAGVIVFIEVKARSDHEFGHPFDALTPTKQKKIRQTTQKFFWSRRESLTNLCGSMWWHLHWIHLIPGKLNCSKTLFRFDR